ncbi:MAG: TonB-dependent receptor [Sphingomonas fennica]
MRIRALLRYSTAMALAIGAAPSLAAGQDGLAAVQGNPNSAEATSTQPNDVIADQATGTSGQDASDTGLADIVVTAQRRAENLQRAAIAVTAVTGDTLVRAGVTDTLQLTRVAPALQITTLAGSATQFYLRGVGNFTSNSLSDAAVAVNLDGVTIARSSAVQGFFYDLERIEVLKGPQGTLYGRNATGGAINIITAKPRAGELGGYATVEYGNYDQIRGTAAINLPAGDNGAFRVSGFWSDRDGFYTDGSGDEEIRALRVQGAAQLTDAFKLTVGGDVAHVGGKGAGVSVRGLDRDAYIGVADPRAGALYEATFAPLAGDFLNALPDTQYQNNLYWGMYAQADMDTAIGTVTLLPAYRDATIRFLGYGGSFAFQDELKDEQLSAEVRLASNGGGPLSYILGGYYLDERIAERANFNQQYFAPYVDFDSRTKSYAGFARLTLKVTDALRLVGGARYTIDDKSALMDSFNVVVICAPVLPPPGQSRCPNTPSLPVQLRVPGFLLDPATGNPLPFPIRYGPAAGPGGTSLVSTTRSTITPSRTFKKLTYRLGFEVDVAPQSLLYGTFETGFKSGGFFATVDNPVYEPETIDAFTLGMKNRFLDNRLQLNLEAFWWNYKDQQVSHFRTSSAGGTEFITENVGKSRIRGFEVEGRARVAQGTTLNATVQYLDAKYQNFFYQNPATLGPPVTGCAVTGPAAGQFTINCSGRRPYNAPEWALTGGVEQVFELGGGSRITFNADGRYQSKIYTGFEQLPAELQKGYFIGDVQVQYEFGEPRISVAGFVNNVTDKSAVQFAQPHPRAAFNPVTQTSGLITEALRPPRVYGIRVGYKF